MNIMRLTTTKKYKSADEKLNKFPLFYIKTCPTPGLFETTKKKSSVESSLVVLRNAIDFMYVRIQESISYRN